MLGDSLTALGEWSRLLPGMDVGNRGLGSETSAGLRARIEDGEPVGPTAVILIGINDARAHISADETEANIRAIVDRLRGRRILLQSTLPRTTRDDTDRTTRLATFEQQLCADGRCRFVDLRPALAPSGVLEPRFAVDDTHLSWPAYLRWGAIVRAALAEPSAASRAPAA